MSTANSVNSGLDCASPESIMDPTNLNAGRRPVQPRLRHVLLPDGPYPFPDGTAVEKMMCHQHKQPTPIKDLNPAVPDDMVAIVERLMQKNPTSRYGGCGEVIAALRPLTQPSGPSQPKHRTLSMPRVKLPRPAAPEPAAEAPPAAAHAPEPQKPAARLNQFARPGQPLPPRAPSASINAPAPSPAPVSQPAPAPMPGPAARLSRMDFSRRAEEPAPAPITVRRHGPLPVEHEPAPAPVSAPAPAPQAAEGPKFGLVTVVLLATLAGVAAFFLSKMIPL